MFVEGLCKMFVDNLIYKTELEVDSAVLSLNNPLFTYKFTFKTFL